MSDSTADLVLAALAPHDLKQRGNHYRANNPTRPGSNSHALSVVINGPEHGAWIDFVSNETGSLYTLADKLGVRRPRVSGSRARETVYTYTDADGAALFEVVRSCDKNGDKTFKQRLPGASDWGRGNAPYVLYHLPEVRAAVAAGETVYIAEGEKDADLLGLFGLTGTTSPGGAGNTNKTWGVAAFCEPLRGADVVILPDNDDPGERHADQVRAALLAVGARVRVVRLPNLPHKGDVSDWYAQGGHDLDELLGLVAATPYATAQGTPATAQSDTPPTRRHLLHADELRLIPATTWLIPGVLGLNKLSQLFGAPGSGKSLLALDQALCVAQHAPVVYVAAEAPEDYEERVAAWCAHHQLGRGDLYFWDEPIPLGNPQAVDAFISEITAVRPALVVIDPLAACMVGLEESSTGDMTIAVDALNRIRRETRAAVNIVHHTGWSDTHERGSSVLRAACRVVIKLGADDSDLMTLTCEKANNGKPFDARYFRRVAAGPGVVPIPAARVMSNTGALSLKQLQILEALSLKQHQDGASFSQILDTTEQGKSTLNKGLHRMLERGLVKRDGRTYSLTDAGTVTMRHAQDAEEFTSSPSSPSHGELAVNWAVNFSALEHADRGDIARPNAEFTEFTADHAVVHHDQATIAPEQFTAPTASQCDSSPQFTASSPISSPPQFTSSPVAPPLWGAGGELNQERTENKDGGTSPPRIVGYKPWVGDLWRQRREAEEAAAAAGALGGDEDDLFEEAA